MREPCKIIADILRVNHAGEYGAVRIYEGQRLLALWRAADLVPFLDHTLIDERNHRIVFGQLMQERGVIPCRTLAIWGVGGFLLGLTTGLFGRSAILICTEAVERTVHRHLTEQLDWLADRDVQVSRSIAAIQVEELEHLQSAHRHGPRRSTVFQALDGLIAAATETLIWLSTYGASSRMARGIASRRS